MLPKDSWREHEPRFGFPVFREMKTFVSFAIRPDFKPLNYSKIVVAAKSAVRQGPGGAAKFFSEYVPLVLNCYSKRLRFRIIVTSREGELRGVYKLPSSYPPGGSIDIDVTEALSSLRLPDDDYMAIIIMSNGRHDGFRSSPGSYSMTYVGERIYTTFRTGGFARTLNDPRHKRHVGFRGINPKAMADERAVSSLLLINHSSNPLYDETVTPRTILLRADGATREAEFGPIRPFGGVERSLEDLFGPDVQEFLAPFGGRATTITTCQGVTLASLHLLHARDGSSMSIEHSRPTHTYLLSGVG
jgi:hypothetical protein